MRFVIGVASLLALGACSSDPRTAEAFWRTMGNTAAPARNAPPPYQLPVRPMNPAPATQSNNAGVMAHWTGQSKQVQTITGAMMWECIYNYAGKNYALLFDGFCPSSAQLR